MKRRKKYEEDYLVQNEGEEEEKIRFIITVTGDLNDESYNAFLLALNDYIAAPDDYSGITLYITSGGGNADIGFAMYDVLRSFNTSIYTLAIGNCSSAALLLFALGEKRFASENTSFVVHSARMFYDLQQTPNITLYTNKLLLEVNKKMCKILKQVTKPEYFNEKIKSVIDLSQEMLYDTNEMLEFGIATDVFKDFKDIT